MKVKTPKDGPIDRLYRAAVEIVDGTRKVFAQQGHDPREVRLPILMHGTDMRVTIEAGPAVAARNAVEHAQMQASGKPAEPAVDMSRVLRDAAAIIKQSADETRGAHTINGRWRVNEAEAREYCERCDAIVAGLAEIERLI